MLIAKAWNLGKGFFISKEYKAKAYFLLIVSIILQLAMVYGSVVMNKWNNEFYNALQEFDKVALYKALKSFCIIVACLIFIFVSKYVCQAKLALNWRIFMTEQYYSKWLKNHACFGYHVLNHNNDNPDQRISEDLNSFTSLTIELFFGILNSVVTLFSFVTILWYLSNVFKFTLLNIDLSIPGYLVWVALIYSLFGTVITYIVGKRLAGIDFLQEQREANFRFALVRVRENAESVALYNGEAYEKNIFKNALDLIIQNILKFISVNKNLGIWTNLYNNFANVAPIIFASPMYFAKTILLGGLMQIASAFGHVQESLSFLISSFKTIASYQAVVDRLTGFNENIDHWVEESDNSAIRIGRASVNNLSIKNLTIHAPDNKVLLDKLNLSFEPGKLYLITGGNGCGKSTLIKAMAGIWIFGNGQIIFPENKTVFFIPQNTYMNMGTLLQVIMYPSNEEGESNYIIELLSKVNLSYLEARLNSVENWSNSLSLGEQQKLTILRAIIHKPDILIMDESTSSLTEMDEKMVYDLLKEKLPNAIIISVGHRHSLKKLHDVEIDINKFTNNA